MEPVIHRLKEFEHFPWERLYSASIWKVVEGDDGSQLKGEWYIEFENPHNDRRDIWIIPQGIIALIDYCRQEGRRTAEKRMRQSIGIEE